MHDRVPSDRDAVADDRRVDVVGDVHGRTVAEPECLAERHAVPVCADDRVCAEMKPGSGGEPTHEGTAASCRDRRGRESRIGGGEGKDQRVLHGAPQKTGFSR
jgi:hypothetical protein